VCWYQKGKTNLDLTEARDNEWQWHQPGHMQVCTSLQTDNHASTPPLFFTDRMPFLSRNQQRQSTEGIANNQRTIKSEGRKKCNRPSWESCATRLETCEIGQSEAHNYIETSA